MNRFLHLVSLVAATAAGAFALTAYAAHKKPSLVSAVVAAYQENHSFTVPAAGTLEVAFSPNEGTEHLVVKVIDSARSDVRVLSYSFTSAPVTEALLRAKHRGVNVRVVADEKNNISEDRSGKARAALSALSTAGVDVRTIRIYPIHHDKVVVVDGKTVELGSFNYSDAAAHKNSENVLVNWNNEKLAQVYLGHFERNYAQATPYQGAY
jgi:phosphatidylserine/phosphatidylglycerophosphate/cardiolipin synthase-like enzyme